jgi:putative copper resistance protein D
VLGALALAEGITWLSIGFKAMVYATTMLAAGSVLVLASLKHLSEKEKSKLRRIAIGMGVLAALSSLMRLPIRASFLMGGTWAGASDPMILNMVSEGPLGTSIAVRLAGLGLILSLALPHRKALSLATCGAVIACASFVFRGHALEEPRLLLGLLITLHVLGLAFWIGAFVPLLRAARHQDLSRAGAVAHEFGQKALWVVGGLSLVGALSLGVLTNWTVSVVFTPYGQFFIVKLCLFAGVLSLAAVNKIRLTPALQRGDPQSAKLLARSILIEAALVALILLTTAALTTVSGPPISG